MPGAHQQVMPAAETAGYQHIHMLANQAITWPFEQAARGVVEPNDSGTLIDDQETFWTDPSDTAPDHDAFQTRLMNCVSK